MHQGEAPVNLNIHCAQPQNISFYLSGQTTDDDTTFINLAGSAGEVSKGMGVQLMRNGYVIPANKAISLGRVNSSTSLGLKARYGMTGERVTAGKVKSIIDVNFIYE
ncbi:fimbrial protein [Proteus sp. G4400]|uniref:fimbrial protein n=1 Tax=Proteus sp. G4400 TaxID=2698856 RepID=UPI003075B683